MYRKQIEQITRDLEKKIVFIVGPRQVGKTWLAKEVARGFPNAVYLNYDRFEDRRIIETETWPASTDLLVLDEIHKMPEWKNRVKGIFDTRPEGLRILVTGSARLDTFRQGGDSMAGRFFLHRLLPFTLAEPKNCAALGGISRLLDRGGFPEPFLAEDVADAKRWRNQYVDGLIRTDILDFEVVHDLRAMKTVFELLRRSVGSPISFASIARDANISPTTATKYVGVLEDLYIVFKVHPWSRNIARSILKAPKVYFFDTGLVVGDEGARFENLVALSLMKHVCGTADWLGENRRLSYLRTREGREVDFCVTGEEGVELAIEVKNRDASLSPGLAHFCGHYGFRGLQLARDLRRERTIDGIDIRGAENFLGELFL